MKFLKALLTVALLLGIFLPRQVLAHCEIPCGIYDDQLRISLLEDNITTIEKSMQEINSLSGQTPLNYNQIVRWVENKEEHADNIRQIVTQYFLAQRVKPAEKKDKEAYEKYLNQLTLLHQMIVYAMKAKQTTDLANVEKMRSLVLEFKSAYSGLEGTPPEHK